MSEVRIARSHAVQTKALYIAEAGVELALARLCAEPGFTGVFNGQVSGGSFSVEVRSETPDPGEAGKRKIRATGSWGGGQQQAAAQVTFTHSFLFRHAFLSDGTAEILRSTISGPVRLQALHQNSRDNIFDSDQDGIANEQEDQSIVGLPAGYRIPHINFGHYQELASNNPSLWHVTSSRDLDESIRNANNRLVADAYGLRSILITSSADDDGNDTVTLDAPVSFSGLVVIQADEVRIKDNINTAPNQNNPFVILTTGDINVPAGPGHSVDTLGGNTLLYSNGRVNIEGRQLSGIVVAKDDIEDNKNSGLRNTNLAFNNAMLHLLQRDAQPEFRQEAGSVMNVTFISPQP